MQNVNDLHESDLESDYEGHFFLWINIGVNVRNEPDRLAYNDNKLIRSVAEKV